MRPHYPHDNYPRDISERHLGWPKPGESWQACRGLIRESENQDGTVRLNSRNISDGLVLLRAVCDLPLVFFDPQYRAGLDKLAFGNEAARQVRRSKLPAMSNETIEAFVDQIDRALRPSGYLMLWVDKFTLVEKLWEEWCVNATLLPVDLITWRKNTYGMGKRSRRVSEYLLILQKPPVRASATWTDHGIEDDFYQPRGWERDNIPWWLDCAQGPHRKPVLLQRRLVEATTRPGELVVDPCAGSYSTFDAARLAGRDFLGCDLI